MVNKVFIKTDDKRVAMRAFPWALRIKRVNDGFMCFRTNDDYNNYNKEDRYVENIDTEETEG